VNAAGVTRRDVLAATAVLVSGGAVSALCIDSRQQGDFTTDLGATVILQASRYQLPHDLARRVGGNDACVIQLEADPVRQWRGPQAQRLAARDTRLLGVTSWPQFLLVRGLAEESGRRVRYQRMDDATGAITWLIA
jgi:hypothetical protein